MWSTLAVVSDNDFANNVSGFGLERNFKILRSIPNAQSQSTRQLVKQYCQIMEGKHRVKEQFPIDQCLDNHFEPAEDIFFMQYQELAPGFVVPPTHVERSDQALWDLVQAVDTFFATSQARKEKQEEEARAQSYAKTIKQRRRAKEVRRAYGEEKKGNTSAATMASGQHTLSAQDVTMTLSVTAEPQPQPQGVTATNLALPDLSPNLNTPAVVPPWQPILHWLCNLVPMSDQFKKKNTKKEISLFTNLTLTITSCHQHTLLLSMQMTPQVHQMRRTSLTMTVTLVMVHPEA
ncbi:hypothetical protein BG000_005921 [Podila horticola]|nr:hypothetical protein BG000_005921 [Podila horticola]